MSNGIQANSLWGTNPSLEILEEVPGLNVQGKQIRWKLPWPPSPTYTASTWRGTNALSCVSTYHGPGQIRHSVTCHWHLCAQSHDHEVTNSASKHWRATGAEKDVSTKLLQSWRGRRSCLEWRARVVCLRTAMNPDMCSVHEAGRRGPDQGRRDGDQSWKKPEGRPWFESFLKPTTKFLHLLVSL
jgi:hypothetical protein